jgi:alpha-N-arabinofuranosidase
MMDNRFHYDFFISKVENKRILNLRYTLDSLKQTMKQIPLKDGDVELMIQGDKKNYQFSYRQLNGLIYQVGTLNTRFLGTEVSGGYNGVVIGLYATGNGKTATRNSYFDWFEYTGL